MNILLLLPLLVTNKLLYANTFIRHGAVYPSGELYDAIKYADVANQLTPVGMRQQYLLGTYLKQTYINDAQLIAAKYNPRSIEVFTTSYQRSLTSAQAFLHGLFPLGQGWVIPSEVTPDKFIPPYDGASDSLGPGFALSQGVQVPPTYQLDSVFDNCPSYGVLMTNRLKAIAQQLTQFQAQHTVQIAKLKLVFNLSVLQTTLPTIVQLYQTIVSDKNLGNPLPKQFDSYDDTQLTFINDYYNTAVFSGSFGATLTTPIFRLLRQKLLGVGEVKKWSIFHFHLSNMLPMLTMLNLTSAECLLEKWKGQQLTALNCMVVPNYAASLTLQLHEDDSFIRSVKVQYNGQYVYLCERKQYECEISDFVARLAAIETNFQAECKAVKEGIDIQVY